MKVLHYADLNNLMFRVPWMDLIGELHRRGIEQTLLCRPNGNLESIARERGLSVVTWEPAIKNVPSLNITYPKIIRKIKPDVVHTRLSSAAAIAGFWGRFLGVPTIAMLDWVAKKKYYKNADYFTACSHWVKDEMVTCGLDSKKIEVVYNSIDVKKYEPNQSIRQEFRAKCGLSPNNRVFVAAGRFCREKGFDVLLKAFAAAGRGDPSLRLLLAGDGQERDLYERLISDLEIRDRVTLSKGYEADIRPWLWGADCFVLPSREEPFGIIVLEAMASDLPVIATDKGGPREFIEDGKNGFLIPAGDVQRMAATMIGVMGMDEKSKIEVSACARERLSYFSKEVSAQRQIELYEKILQKRGRERQ